MAKLKTVFQDIRNTNVCITQLYISVKDLHPKQLNNCMCHNFWKCDDMLGVAGGLC